MRRILLDQSAPAGIRRILTLHYVETAYRHGWHVLDDGELLQLAEQAGFEVFVTADQNIRHQQNLASRRIAVVILLTNRWPVIKAAPGALVEAAGKAEAGSPVLIPYGQKSRRRGPATPGD